MYLMTKFALEIMMVILICSELSFKKICCNV